MSLSLREVAVAAPFSLSCLHGIGVVAAAPHERLAELMQLPVAGMIVGALVIAVNAAVGYGVDRAAANRLPAEVMHP